MAPATTKTVNNNGKANPGTQAPEVAQKIREQMFSTEPLFSTLRTSQDVSLDAAQTWVKAISASPVPDLPAIPGITDIAVVEAAIGFAFDVAVDLFSAQLDYALQFVKVFTSDKSV
jgi:hypothetical protein